MADSDPEDGRENPARSNGPSGPADRYDPYKGIPCHYWVVLVAVLTQAPEPVHDLIAAALKFGI